MRMKIKVRPKRKHSHLKKTESTLTTTTIPRTSPKLLATKPYKKTTTQLITSTTYIEVKQAGLYKGVHIIYIGFAYQIRFCIILTGTLVLY